MVPVVFFHPNINNQDITQKRGKKNEQIKNTYRNNIMFGTD